MADGPRAQSVSQELRPRRAQRHLPQGRLPRRQGLRRVPVNQVGPAHLSGLIGKFNKPTRIRVISAVKKIIAVAKRKELIKHSPFSDIDFNEGFAKHKEKKRPAIIDETKFGELMRKIDGYEGRSQNLTAHALKLLALTFVRPDLVAKAEWKQFNLKKAQWVIPFETLKMEWLRSETGEATEDFVVPLSRQAVVLLRPARDHRQKPPPVPGLRLRRGDVGEHHQLRPAHPRL